MPPAAPLLPLLSHLLAAFLRLLHPHRHPCAPHRQPAQRHPRGGGDPAAPNNPGSTGHPVHASLRAHQSSPSDLTSLPSPLSPSAHHSSPTRQKNLPKLSLAGPPPSGGRAGERQFPPSPPAHPRHPTPAQAPPQRPGTTLPTHAPQPSRTTASRPAACGRAALSPSPLRERAGVRVAASPPPKPRKPATPPSPPLLSPSPAG